MFSSELKKGSTEMLVLSLLEARPRHGYEIGKLTKTRRSDSSRSGGRSQQRIHSRHGFEISPNSSGFRRDFARPKSDPAVPAACRAA